MMSGGLKPGCARRLCGDCAMKKHRSAVVVGAGIGGLLAASALAAHFETVTVIEKDKLPDRPNLRRSVPHGAHVHTLPAFGCEALNQLLPGMVDDLYRAGATKLRRNLDILFFEAGEPAIGKDAGISTPSMSQPMIEFSIRKRLLELQNVKIMDQSRCAKIEKTGDMGCRVWIKRPGGVEVVAAALVVVSTGKSQAAARGLLDDGSAPIDRLEVSMGYTTAKLTEPALHDGDTKAVFCSASPPSSRTGYFTRIENGKAFLTLFSRGGDHPDASAVGILDWVSGLAHPEIADRLRRSKAGVEISRYRFKNASWARHDLLPPTHGNVIVLGDSYACLNPVHGQGISMAASQALVLRQILEAAGGNWGEHHAKDYFERTRGFIQRCWDFMAVRDFAYPSTVGERPEGIDDAWMFEKAALKAAANCDELFVLKTRVNQMLEDPQILRTSPYLEKIEAYL